MTTFLFILLVLACFIIIGTVLLQPAKAGASALGGTSQSIFGSTGGTTFLFRVTMGCAFFVMAACLFLSWNKIRLGKTSVVDLSAPAASVAPLSNPTAAPTTAPVVAPVAPAAPTTPVVPDKK